MKTAMFAAVDAAVTEIAVRVGDENAGFAGDAESRQVEESVYELWEGAGYIVWLPTHVLCVYYNSDVRGRTFAHGDVSGVLGFIREVDLFFREQASD